MSNIFHNTTPNKHTRAFGSRYRYSGGQSSRSHLMPIMRRWNGELKSSTRHSITKLWMSMGFSSIKFQSFRSKLLHYIYNRWHTRVTVRSFLHGVAAAAATRFWYGCEHTPIRDITRVRGCSMEARFHVRKHYSGGAHSVSADGVYRVLHQRKSLT